GRGRDGAHPSSDFLYAVENLEKLGSYSLGYHACAGVNGGRSMSYYLVKLVVTTVLIVLISEIAKRSSLIGAILASIPLVSVLAMIWLYVETKDVAKVSALATGVFWLVLPSLALFLVLPPLLKQGVNFYLSLGISATVTVACYFGMVAVLQRFGIKL
ncbi:MAG: DUF3147 family protein, partial [Kiritimatiellia bacterium]